MLIAKPLNNGVYVVSRASCCCEFKEAQVYSFPLLVFFPLTFSPLSLSLSLSRFHLSRAAVDISCTQMIVTNEINSVTFLSLSLSRS